MAVRSDDVHKNGVFNGPFWLIDDWSFLTLSLTNMETLMVVLSFESVDEILWCDHSNETSSAVLSHGTINFISKYFTT